MDVNHQHLKAFHAVAVDGSVSRAARRLGVSQPTLSQQLRSLELRHGVTLFESRKPPLQLTAAGRQLFELTQSLFSVSDEIDAVLSHSGPAQNSAVRIGSDSPAIGAQLVACALQLNPDVDARLRIGNADEVVAWLRDARIDVAIASDPPTDPSIYYMPIYRDQLIMGLPVRHPLAVAGARPPLSALAGETLLLREAASRTRRAVLGLLEAAEVKPRKIIDMHTREAIREGIAMGLGVSFFYSAECPPDARLCYREIDVAAPAQSFTGYLMCTMERRRVPAMRALFQSAAPLKAASPLPL